MKVFEGTWDEIAAHREEFAGRRLRVTVGETPDEVRIGERLARLREGLAIIEEAGKGMGPYPNYTMDNDFLYPDDEEQA